MHHPEDLYRQHERDAAEMRKRIGQLKREMPNLTAPPLVQLPDFQGVQTLSALAAVLVESDWWYFWWY